MHHNLAVLFLLSIFLSIFSPFFSNSFLVSVSSAGYFMGDGLAVVFRSVDAVGASAVGAHAAPKAHAVADTAGPPPTPPPPPLPPYSSCYYYSLSLSLSRSLSLYTYSVLADGLGGGTGGGVGGGNEGGEEAAGSSASGGLEQVGTCLVN